MSDDGVGRDSPKFMLRLPVGMRERIAEAAKANNRSMNAEIVSRLESSLLSNSASRYVGPVIETVVRDAKKFYDVIEKTENRLEEITSQLASLKNSYDFMKRESDALKTTQTSLPADFRKSYTSRLENEMTEVILKSVVLTLLTRSGRTNNLETAVTNLFWRREKEGVITDESIDELFDEVARSASSKPPDV